MDRMIALGVFRYLSSDNGISLLELMIATILVVLVVLMMALLVPRASKQSFSERQHWQANEQANAMIQSIQSTPYGLITVTTDPGGFFANANCDCRDPNNDYTKLPSNISTVNSIAYNIQSCVNFVDATGGTWQPKCLAANQDTGSKAIRAHVTWSDGNQAYAINADGMVSQ